MCVCLWEGRQNLWLRETSAIMGNSLGKGRGTGLGRDMIYRPLTYTFLFMEEPQ